MVKVCRSVGSNPRLSWPMLKNTPISLMFKFELYLFDIIVAVRLTQSCRGLYRAENKLRNSQLN